MTAEQIADALRELRDAAQRERLASEEAESLYAELREAGVPQRRVYDAWREGHEAGALA